MVVGVIWVVKQFHRDFEAVEDMSNTLAPQLSDLIVDAR